MADPFESPNVQVTTGTPSNEATESGRRMSVWNFVFLTLFVVFLICAACLLVTHGRRVRLYQLIIIATEAFGLPVALVAMFQNARHENWTWLTFVLLAQLVMLVYVAQYF